MYLPLAHRMDDHEQQRALIDAHPLGAWVCQADEGLVANHVPFLLDRSRGPLGSLIGHVSRANPVWHGLGPGAHSVVMFQGPQAYITPGWYPSRHTHGEVVPTWNYAAVHAHGVARVIEDRAWLLDMLQRLTVRHEASQVDPWQLSDPPAAFMEAMVQSIVGIEIIIDRLEGKLKASQDEALLDRLGTVQGLRGAGCPHALAVAALVQGAVAP